MQRVKGVQDCRGSRGTEYGDRMHPIIFQYANEYKGCRGSTGAEGQQVERVKGCRGSTGA